ncbi:MAG TPA: TAT-variant-translocated molybdopterin oxidoreductase, partial [Thermoguttaceae bacterium]
MSPLEKNQQLKYTDYWRSLGELKDAPEYREFLEAEFPSAEDPEGISRRRWLQLMGASLTLASVAACRWEKREILPFDKRPANRTPGKFEHYTTARDMGGTALGLLVTCIDGRPIKIEGNPKHPYSLGATDAHAQAAILELYDPDRSKNIILKTDRDDMVKTWEEFAAFVGSHFHDLRKNGGRGFAVLAETSTSPTLAALQKRLQAVLPQSIWLQYEPIANEFGDIRTHLFLDKAEVIVCLDADLFGSHPAAVKLARDFAVGREVKDGKMNRLYVVESCFSITGAMADHRLPMRSTAIAPFAKMLLQALETQMNQTSPGASPASHIDVMAKDLLAHKGKSVVVVGAGQPKEVELIARQINQRLDNVGRTVHYTETPVVAQQQQISGLESLVADMTSGKISTLLVLGGNPVYNSPADINFAQALQNVTTSIHLSNYRNETSLGCTWHLPQAHFLESWGDARAFDGSYSIIQPMIEPLHGGKSAIELLAMILEEKSSAYDLVRASFKEISKTDDLEKHWPAALREGFVTGSLLKEREIQPDVDLSKIGDSLASALENGHLEIVFRPSSALYDGRFANNGWLQEMPDPLTRVTWDNAAVMSPKTAERLGVTDNTLVKLKFQGREAEIPVYILPGQADGSVAVALGYGRTAAGLVGGSTSDDIPSVGVDVYRMRTSKSMNFSPGLSVEPTGKTYRLATVEDHFAIDRVGMEGRAERAGELIREATLEDFLKHPDFAKSAVEHPPLQSL